MKKTFLLMVLYLITIPIVIAFDEYIYFCYDNKIWLSKCTKGICDADDDEYIGNCVCKSVDGIQINEKTLKTETYVREKLCKGSIINDFCTDDDYGAVYDEYGCVRGYKNNEAYTKCDECISEILYEYYCSGTQSYLDKHACINCQSGECITKPMVEICDNNMDDDLDNLIDCSDPDCSNTVECRVLPPPECKDGAEKEEGCDNGDIVATHICTNGKWVATGNKCREENNILFWIVLVIVIGAIGGTIYYLFFRKEKGGKKRR